jgi:four helix bundle protein
MKNGEVTKHKVTRFTELDSWKNGHSVVIAVFDLTKDWSAKYQALSSQMQRAAVSITSNIAEGFGRQNHTVT